MQIVLNSAQQKFAQVQHAWLATAGSQARSHFLPYKALKGHIHVLEAGAGDPLLLLHGGNAFSALWEPLLFALQSDHHLIAPDRFNCGLSTPINYKKLNLIEHAIHFMDAVFDHYGFSSVNVMGNSLGGYWAMLYALHKPERINKIILIGAPGGTQAPPFILRLSSLPLINQFLFYLMMRAPDSTEKLFERALVADIKHLPPAIFPLMHLGLRLPGAQKAWLDILEMTCTVKNIKPQYWLLDKLPQIQHKTLLLWGDKDVFGTQSQAREVQSALPHAELNMIPNAGHMPWLDQGEYCARAIREFLVVK
ncbi:MAG TPA: alpha/beta hydrolase, partial [Gammaproteobacteria bacterium]|nr:alpha/beta hydrolase [Gammaproteobacteria bacterium]